MAIAFITFMQNSDHSETVYELQTKTMESDTFLCSLKQNIVITFSNKCSFMIFTQNSYHNKVVQGVLT